MTNPGPKGPTDAGRRGFDKAGLGKRAGLLAAIQAAILAFFIAGTHGWLTPLARQETTDFASFYAAGALADGGRPAAAYDRAIHFEAEKQATYPTIKYQYFFNPPPFLLIMAPLARLPYIAAFLVFEAATLAFWLAIGTRVAGGGGAALRCLLAVPSLWWVLGLGQNAFLTAGLMGLGTLLIDRRPALAGVCFGALAYKPHLALAVPVALAAGRRWRAVAAAAATLGLICALTTLLFGIETWAAFLAMVRGAGREIGSGDVLFAAHIDPAGAARFAGLPWAVARPLGALVVLAAAAALALVWRRGASREARGAALAAASLMLVPFALFYDLVMASLAAAWLARAGRARGFLAGEPAALVVCVLANLVCSIVVVARPASFAPLGAVVAPVLLALAVRRAWVESAAGPSSPKNFN